MTTSTDHIPEPQKQWCRIETINGRQVLAYITVKDDVYVVRLIGKTVCGAEVAVTKSLDEEDSRPDITLLNIDLRAFDNLIQEMGVISEEDQS